MKTLSLELSKKLHELGVVVVSEVFWATMFPEKGELYLYSNEFLSLPSNRVRIKTLPIPAPTFEELWAVMPEIAELTKVGGKTYADIDGESATQSHESPTEALGLLAIWLAENGHLEETQ